MIRPTLEEFQELAKHYSVVPVWRELVADYITPVAAFDRLCGNDEPGFLLESVDHAERWSRWSFLGRRAAATLVARDGEVSVHGGRLPSGIRLDQGILVALEDVLERYRSPQMDELPPFHGGLVGYLGYDVVREVEHLPAVPPDDRGYPDAVLSIVGDLAAFDHYRQRVTLISNAYLFGDPNDVQIGHAYYEAVARLEQLTADGARSSPEAITDPPDPEEPLPEVTSSMGGEAYRGAVEVAKEHILAGDIFQVVLAQRFDFELDADPFDVYRVLRQVNPSPYMYLVRTDELSLVGSSPEPMVQLLDGRVISRPIAGTRRRGRTDEEDRQMGAELVEHPKELAEHVMLVDLARNDVGRVVTFGTEHVDEMMTLERYSHVMHLTSQVSGELAEGKNAIDVLRATLPAGTVSGAPKVRAMEIIDDLEPVKRGPYAGVVGYLDFSGNIDTAIAIRTMVVGRNGEASVAAGAGVVADSVPEHEDLECHNKAQALLAAVPAARRMTVARRAQARMKGVPRNVRDKALWDGVGAVVVERGWVNVVGPDAGTFLQGQVTQDVLALGLGEAAWTFVLEPDGKVLALVRVVRLFDEAYGLDMEVGETEVVLERLKRFLLRVDCELSMLPPRTMIAIRGPDLPHVKFNESALVMRLPVGWPGVVGVDQVGGSTEPPPNLPVCRPEALEALRIESGWPMSGVDIAPGAVVADAPGFVIDQAVSFTKGCYTGQELVERMHSRHVPAPHPLRGLQLGDGAPVPPGGAEVVVEGEVVGAVTSAAWSAWREGPVAMARIARKVTRPVAGVVRWKDDEAAVRIVDLP